MIPDYSEVVSRAKLEERERWQEIVEKMPYFELREGWQIAVIPPTVGAVARFRIKQDKGHVSIYADWYEKLGYFGQPHWEIYPNKEGDNERFAINDTVDMIEAVALSLAEQNK